MQSRCFVATHGNAIAAGSRTPHLPSVNAGRASRVVAITESIPLMTPDSNAPRPTRKILIAGGGFMTPFLRYMAELTGKPRPRICYLPSAVGDMPVAKLNFYGWGAPLNVEPFVQDVFIASL